MPNIQEYLPEQETQGAIGGISPNTELAGREGRGIEEFGKSISEAGAVVAKRQEQSESAEVFSSVSDARVDFHNQLVDSINDGTLDIDKFNENYQKWQDQESDKYSSRGAQNYFERQSSRLKGTLLQTAVHGQAIIAQKNAVADFQNGMTANTNAVQNDPTQFTDVYDSMQEDLNQKLKTGAITAAQVPQFKQLIGEKLSESALRGYAQNDADNLTNAISTAGAKVDPSQFNSAQKMLDSGAFDEYLSSDKKKQMEAEIRQHISSGEVEGNRVLTAQKSQQAIDFERWEQSSLPKLVNNSLSVKEILNAPGTAEQKYRWMNMVKEASKAEVKTDPAVKNSLIARMNLPDNDPKKISDPGQLQSYVGKGISPQDYDGLTTWFDKTPAGQALNANRRSLLEYGKAELVKGGGMFGKPDPNGEYNMMRFSNDLQSAETAQRAAGKPIADLYNTNSPDFFGNKINNYRKTRDQLFTEFQARSTGKPIPVPQMISTQPGVLPSTVNSQPSAPAAPAQDEMVSVIAPDGSRGKIPKSKLSSALGKGYRQ